MPAMPEDAQDMSSELRRAIAPWCGMLDALHCGASIIDRAGRIVYINDRLCRMMRRDRDELIGMRVADQYADPQMRDRVARMLEKFDRSSEAETYIERPDGSRLPVLTASKPLEADALDGPLRVVTVNDITRLKEAMDDIAELSDTVLSQAVDLKRQAEALDNRVRERTAELRAANMDAIYMLAVASEARDGDTGAHVRRIERYARAVAIEMGLPDAQARRIGYSAILHDVGKIHTPDEILKKPGKLTAAERARMQRHTVVGEAILSTQPFFETARQIARSHHENYDGSGYPDRAAGQTIPPAARVVHAVDVFDALSSPRVYKDAWPLERAAQVIRDGREKDFDPCVVDAFVALFDRDAFAQIRRAVPDCDGRDGGAVIDSPPP